MGEVTGVQMASKSPTRKSFVSGENVCKRLIWLPWHGRGREFESHQVHQNLFRRHYCQTSRPPIPDSWAERRLAFTSALNRRIPLIQRS